MKKRLFLALGVALLIPHAGLSQESLDFKPHNEPLVKQNPPKPNILMVLDTSGSMNGQDMRDENNRPTSRIAVLRKTVEDLLTRYRKDARIGFTTLGPRASYYATGSRYDFAIEKQPITDFDEEMSDLEFEDFLQNKIRPVRETNQSLLHNPSQYNLTPLTFAIYEAAKVLRGKPMAQYSNRGKLYKESYRTAPITYRCQEQHMILMTDGDGFYDAIARQDLVSGDPNSLTVANPRNRERDPIDYSQHTKFLWNLDLRTDATFARNVDNAGKGWSSKGSKPMPIYFNAISFGKDVGATSKKILEKSVKPSNGIYVSALDTTELNRAFHQIFQKIIQTQSGTGAVEDQQNTHTTNSVRYLTKYNPKSWTGIIQAYQYDPQTESFSKLLWSTDDLLKNNNGVQLKDRWGQPLYRVQPNQGKFVTGVFNGNSWSTKELTYKNAAPLHPAKLAWIMGHEEPKNMRGTITPDGDDYRLRGASLMGATINSDITYFATDVPNLNLDVISKQQRDQFIKYIDKRRRTMGVNYLITGANDGLISFIAAEKSGKTSQGYKPGTRVVSYFPSFFAKDIKDITHIYYNHQFKVDGTTHLFDFLDRNQTYRSIGITSMGSGGRALVGYQLYQANKNLTTYSSEFKVNFEITNETPGFEDLGYTFSEVDFINQGTINQDTRALAIFGNGFGVKKSIVYIVDPMDGALVTKVLLSNNGLGAGSPSLVTSEDPHTGLQRLDALYVGDYSGDLYKVTFATENADIKVRSKTKLFSTGTSMQPITVRPIIYQHPKNKDFWVYFGTGHDRSLKDTSPEALKELHYFYGLRDRNDLTNINQLVTQGIVNIEENDRSDYLKLYTSSNSQMKVEEYGWKMPLIYRNQSTGERVVKSAVIVGDKYVNFSSWVYRPGDPNDPCLGDSISGNEMMLDLYNGNAGLVYRDSESGELLKHNGRHLNDDAFGRPTGAWITTRNTYGGSYNHGFIDELVDEYGSYAPISKDPKQKTTKTHTTYKGANYSETMLIGDIFGPPESDLTSGKRLYIKQRAI